MQIECSYSSGLHVFLISSNGLTRLARPRSRKQLENKLHGSLPVHPMLSRCFISTALKPNDYRSLSVCMSPLLLRTPVRPSFGGYIHLSHSKPIRSGRNVPTHGKLIGLDRSEIVIETKGSAGSVRCHFPRLGFTVKKADDSTLNKVIDTVKSKL